MPNMAEDAAQPLWKDRKRILGLPISFTKYEVTEDRFITHKGLFSTETNETLLYRIMDIKLVRKFGQKIFGVGTITLFSADRSHASFEVKNIKNPEAVRKFLSKIVEQRRDAKGITGRELYGAAGGASSAQMEFDSFADVDGDGVPD